MPTNTREKKKTNQQNLETFFERLQNKIRDVMGPLGKMWKIFEDFVLKICVEQILLSLG